MTEITEIRALAEILQRHYDCQNQPEYIHQIFMTSAETKRYADALSYAAERERLLREADEVIAYQYGEAEMPADWEPDRIIQAAKDRHRARSSSPAQDEGKPTT